MKSENVTIPKFIELVKNPPQNIRVRVYYESKGREVGVVKTKKNKYTLNQIGDALMELTKAFVSFKQEVNERLDRIEARLDYNNLKKLPETTSNK